MEPMKVFEQYMRRIKKARGLSRSGGKIEGQEDIMWQHKISWSERKRFNELNHEEWVRNRTM